MDSAPAKTDSLTPSQRQAVAARGNVLVMAGAGTGKTKTLVERCLDCLERDGAQIDELLIVTFTEAAAAEMRERLRRAMEAKAQTGSSDFWQEQLARFDLAHIGTLHSFCLKLVREHFYELGLDPRIAILDEGESRQLANETLDEQFTAHYEGKKDFSPAVQELIQVHGGGRDEAIRKLILRLHNYSQARPDAAGWLADQRAKFSTATTTEWQGWLTQAIQDWCADWLPVLKNLQAENVKAAELIGLLSQFKADIPRGAASEILSEIAAADLTANYPKGKAGKLRPALGKIFEEAEFLASLAAIKNGSDPLVEDWSWVHGQMETLLRLAEEFAQLLAGRKRADGVIDFHDLEQFALKLLWDFSVHQPTAVAMNWRSKLKFVFVDEYQDINAAQDKIIQGLSRDGADANRFLVGDVKQSIYRFRLADPKIFRDYAHDWHAPVGKTISLSENFRSHESLLRLVNSVCRAVMRPEIGGVEYDAAAELKPGGIFVASNEDARSVNPEPHAELLVRFKSGKSDLPSDEEDELAGLDDTQREARLVAWRLKQFIASKKAVFDGERKDFRPVEWRDIAILLRSPRGRSEIFAKEFERVGVPLAVARGGFYQSAEILDLQSLLQLLDNPLQDVPCIAVLRSPFVGLSLDELAEIRLAAKEKHFWTTLNHWVNAENGRQRADALFAKIKKFLQQYSSWRKQARQVSLSQCLEEILAETLYADWLQAQPRGAQRAGNITAFLRLAQQFDQFQRQGLFRFLKFIEAQQEAEVEPEVPAAAMENAVRLMSIHQSKGLEFPVVVLADLTKQFNETDLRGDIIFDEKFGLCPKIKPPHAGGRYPSLPHWLAQRRQKRELRGEELRLLYVALTRAREHLILTASVTEKNWEEKWLQPQAITVQSIAGARSFADWFALWFSRDVAGAPIHPALRWQLMDDAQLTFAEAGSESQAHTAPPSLNAAQLAELSTRLEWKYPFTQATKKKAKSSVTALRREATELDEEAEALPVLKKNFTKPSRPRRKSALSAAAVGVAHHKFMQHVAFEKISDIAAEADRLVQQNYLTPGEHAALDLDALAAFWNSKLGKEIGTHAVHVRRELPFTARFSPKEIAAIDNRYDAGGLTNEFIVVQGVADLVVLLDQEIWLVDFKTDDISPHELSSKVADYKPQVQFYAAALEKIFGRPVTRRALYFLAAQRTESI